MLRWAVERCQEFLSSTILYSNWSDWKLLESIRDEAH
jgi:hypothetical protein